MGIRRRGRILAFQSLYSHDLCASPLEELLAFTWLDPEQREALNEESLAFGRLIVQGTVENLASIDKLIENQLEHWDMSRLSRVDLALLRISVYCLVFQKDIPASVTIDEAVDIAKEFGSDDSYRFVNGVLDAIRKRQSL